MAASAPEVPRTRSGIRDWEVFGLPGGVRTYVLGVVLTWACVLVVSARSTSWATRDAAVAGLLVLCAAVALEATRRQGEVSGASKDLLSAWYLPLALVLPPLYILVAPLLLMAWTQVRIRRVAPYRRMFSGAAIGLSFVAGRLAFDTVLALRPAGRPVDTTVWWVVAALAAAMVATVANSVLVAVAVRLFSPEVTLRSLVWDPSSLLIDAAELFVSVMVAVLCNIQPVFALIAVVPMILLQRGLMHDQLTAASRLDPKTGLLNALAWERQADSEITRAVRTRTALSVLLIDLDHFKQVNDRYGHLAGDEAIRAVAGVMKAQVREYDLCGRFGGDEFAVLLPQSDLEEATRTARRIQQQVAALHVPVGDGDVRLTVSIGVAQLAAPTQGVTDLLAAADLSLYRAKAEGRHRVVVHPFDA